jgi:hypothetical protein
MFEPTKFRKRPSQWKIQTSRQKTTAFESGLTRGLTGLERMKVLKQLAQLLMLAAGLASTERDDER